MGTAGSVRRSRAGLDHRRRRQGQQRQLRHVTVGRRTTVAFTSEATNLDPADTDIISDVYVKDLASGELTLVSTSDSGVKGNGSSFAPSLSADGSTVAFNSEATNLDPADTDDITDIYVKDLTTGEVMLVSTSDTGVKGNGVSFRSSLSADTDGTSDVVRAERVSTSRAPNVSAQDI